MANVTTKSNVAINKKNRIKQDGNIQIVAYVYLSILTALVLIPFTLLIIASFTDNDVVLRNGFSFFPEQFSLEAYRYIVTEWATLGRAYGVTIFVTLVGTTISIIITSLLAYALSRDELPGRNIIMFLVVFTMLFNGGIVSTYIIYTNVFGIRDTIWALIVPNLLLSAFQVILVRNYFRFSIPPSLIEAAYLDGASEFGVYSKVVMPLSLPILATVGLMTTLQYWNDWINGLYFLTARNGSHLFSIQNVLHQINENIAFLANVSTSELAGIPIAQLPSNTIRMGIAVVAIFPILLIYPFFIKYFIKGITMGSVKE